MSLNPPIVARLRTDPFTETIKRQVDKLITVKTVEVAKHCNKCAYVFLRLTKPQMLYFILYPKAKETLTATLLSELSGFFDSDTKVNVIFKI